MLLLSSTIFKNHFIDLNSIKFISDDGYFLKMKIKIFLYRTERIVESVDLRGKNTIFPGTFSQLTVRCSGKTEMISLRSYTKIQAAFAYLDGIFQAIVILGQKFVYIFSKNSILYYQMLNLFESIELKNVIGEEAIPIRKISLIPNSVMDESNPNIVDDNNNMMIKKIDINGKEQIPNIIINKSPNSSVINLNNGLDLKKFSNDGINTKKCNTVTDKLNIFDRNLIDSNLKFAINEECKYNREKNNYEYSKYNNYKN